MAELKDRRDARWLQRKAELAAERTRQAEQTMQSYASIRYTGGVFANLTTRLDGDGTSPPAEPAKASSNVGAATAAQEAAARPLPAARRKTSGSGHVQVRSLGLGVSTSLPSIATRHGAH